VKLVEKAIKLRYRSIARFGRDYAQIREGEIFLASKTPFPVGTRLSLEFNLPGIDLAFMVNGLVTDTLEKQKAAQIKKPPGMLVDIIGGPENILKKLEPILSANQEYTKILNLPHTMTTALEASTEKVEIDAIPPADKKTKEVSTASVTADEDTNKDAAHAPAVKQANSTSPEPVDSVQFMMPGAEAFDEEKTAVDSAKAPEAKNLQVPSSGEKSTKEIKKKKVAKSAQQILLSKEMELKYSEASEDENDTGLSLDWIREAVNQKEAGKEEAAEPEATEPPISEKKNLSTEERSRVKPAADFIMNLTKAMLRSGYYAPDHTGSKNAKRGLYEALQKSLGDSEEIMITHQEVGGKTDILIVGILEDPVNVRTLVGAGMSELFVPKLREYFKRKGLISFAIKKDIPLQNFEKFVDIMSDPKSDRGENVQVGELLSNTLAEHGIAEISTVFMDDMIAIEQNLPWRVEMAIQRMAKDLKVLPMFKGKTEQAMANLRLQIIQDIIRPLTHPEFLKDLVINCYVIAKHSGNMDTEELQNLYLKN
jgi:hypothetical protein